MLKIDIVSEETNAALERGVRVVLKTVAEKLGIADGLVEVGLVGSDKLQANVKSYPAPAGFVRPDSQEKFWGTINLNPEYIKEKGEDFDYMLIHGFLHLLGYDHKKESDAEKMEKLEKELLREIKKDASRDAS
jgi:rRNA maturation RNase YbeY